jgi:hypothetical protein
MKMSVNGASMIFGHASWEITPLTGCSQSQRNLCLPLYAQQIEIPSLPHHENERHGRIKDFWVCVQANHTSERLMSVIEEFWLPL